MARNTRRRWLAIAFGGVLSAGGADVSAQQDEEAFDRTPKDCVSVRAIDRTHAVDDRSILFYMRGKKAYLNYLPNECKYLARYDRFQYEVRGGPMLGQLCEKDLIVVLDSHLDTTFIPCRLGEFHPVTAEEIALLTRKPEDVNATVEVNPVELPPAEDAAAEESAAPAEPAEAEAQPPSAE